MAGLSGVHPALASRFNNLLRDVEAKFGAGVLGITSGYRSNAQQVKLYATKPHLAAKPGSSNHEFGAALDLNVKGGWSGQVGRYVHQVAGKYGIWFPMLNPRGKKFEPWHAEAIGINRHNVGKQHDDYGHDENNDAFAQEDQAAPADPVAESMSTVLRALGIPDSQAGATVSKAAGVAAKPANTGAGGPIINLLYNAGFRGQKLVEAYAISKAESGHRSEAHNPNAKTGDNSYGLFQINMLGKLGPARLQQYGLPSNEALFDPATNARVAFQMSNGGSNWRPWSVFKKGSYRQYLSEGQAAAQKAGLL